MSTRKILLISGLTLLLSACASPPSQPQLTHAELEQKSDDAAKTMARCLSENASKTDDGISDATTVARALAQVCFREYRSMSFAVADASGLDDSTKIRFVREMHTPAKQEEMILPFVMSYRSATKR